MRGRGITYRKNKLIKRETYLHHIICIYIVAALQIAFISIIYLSY